jgi:hypothetical protein
VAAGVLAVAAVPGMTSRTGVDVVPGLAAVTTMTTMTTVTTMTTMTTMSRMPAVTPMPSTMAMPGMPARMRQPTERHRNQAGCTGHEGNAIEIHMLDDSIRPDGRTGFNRATIPSRERSAGRILTSCQIPAAP